MRTEIESIKEYIHTLLLSKQDNALTLILYSIADISKSNYPSFDVLIYEAGKEIYDLITHWEPRIIEVQIDFIENNIYHEELSFQLKGKLKSNLDVELLLKITFYPQGEIKIYEQ